MFLGGIHIGLTVSALVIPFIYTRSSLGNELRMSYFALSSLACDVQNSFHLGHIVSVGISISPYTKPGTFLNFGHLAI